MNLRKFFCNTCFTNFEIILEENISVKQIDCPMCDSTDIRSKTKTRKIGYAGCTLACPAASPKKCNQCPNKDRF
jgi:hypothetical protein